MTPWLNRAAGGRSSNNIINGIGDGGQPDRLPQTIDGGRPLPHRRLAQFAHPAVDLACPSLSTASRSAKRAMP